MKTVYANSGKLFRPHLSLVILLTLFLLGGIHRLHAQTSNTFSFTPIPFSDPDILGPHRGTEEWMVMNQVNIPVEGINTQPMDAYYRFEWTQIETAKGVYNWTTVDAAFKRAIDKGQKFSFGIMPLCSNCTGSSIGGAKLTYPSYLHDEMQRETVKDWIHDAVWIPNWNSPNFLTAWENMLKAVSQHINTTFINGIRLSSIVNYIDIRGYGNWGEWHNYPYGDLEPAANRAATSSLLRIIQSHKNAFPDIRLVALTDGFDVANWSRVPAEAGYALLTGTNNVGAFGWRRDNWGDPAFWYKNKLENNPTSYNGQLFRDLIMNTWKSAPIVGEPSSCCTINGGSCQYWELEAQVRRYHTLSFGNGNLEASTSTCVRTNIRNAAKAAGYRLVALGGTVNSTLASGSAFTILMNWQNLGITPTYEKWNVLYQLRDATNKVVWSDTSNFKPYLFLPQSVPTAVSDEFVLPTTLLSGTYQLYMIVTDPGNYRKPLPLAINGRNADGSYLVRAITVSQTTTSVPVIPPLQAVISQSKNPSCFGLTNGSLSVSVSGGKAPFTYKWNDPGMQTSATAVNLPKGTYTVSIKDSVGQTISASATLTEPPLLSLQVIPGTISVYGGSTSVGLSATGGTVPYVFSGPTTTVYAGTYTYTVTDLAGCKDSKTITITQPASTVVRKKNRIKRLLLASTTSTATTATTATNTSSSSTLKWPVQSTPVINRLYPNPASQTATLELSGPVSGTGTLIIRSLQGEVVHQEHIGQLNGRHSLNISNLRSGMYLIQIQSPKGNSETMKLIRQ
jgi:hypothetical protein